MKIANPEKRLEKFWGKVDQKHIQIISQHVQGGKILDLGSGFGSTTAALTRKGFDCIGVDYDQHAVRMARSRFPNSCYVVANSERFPFPDNSFDILILRDSLHHIARESDFKKAGAEILRVAKRKARLIIFEPNIQFLLKTMRKISFHRDAELPFEEAVAMMGRMGFSVLHSGFNTLYSLPLSGGYVGLNFVPNISWLQHLLLKSEAQCERLVLAAHLGRQLSWRYILVGERLPDTPSDYSLARGAFR